VTPVLVPVDSAVSIAPSRVVMCFIVAIIVAASAELEDTRGGGGGVEPPIGVAAEAAVRPRDRTGWELPSMMSCSHGAQSSFSKTILERPSRVSAGKVPARDDHVARRLQNWMILTAWVQKTMTKSGGEIVAL
jgi:hypothetical protein